MLFVDCWDTFRLVVLTLTLSQSSWMSCWTSSWRRVAIWSSSIAFSLLNYFAQQVCFLTGGGGSFLAAKLTSCEEATVVASGLVAQLDQHIVVLNSQVVKLPDPAHFLFPYLLKEEFVVPFARLGHVQLLHLPLLDHLQHSLGLLLQLFVLRAQLLVGPAQRPLCVLRAAFGPWLVGLVEHESPRQHELIHEGVDQVVTVHVQVFSWNVVFLKLHSQQVKLLVRYFCFLHQRAIMTIKIIDELSQWFSSCQKMRNAERGCDLLLKWLPASWTNQMNTDEYEYIRLKNITFAFPNFCKVKKADFYYDYLSDQAIFPIKIKPYRILAELINQLQRYGRYRATGITFSAPQCQLSQFIQVRRHNRLQSLILDIVTNMQLMEYKGQSSRQLQVEFDQPYYNTVPGGFCGWSKVSAKQRKIVSGRRDVDLPRNSIQTAKYNSFDFVPLNLLQQFKNPMNLFVLVVGALNIVPTFTTSASVPTTWIFLFAIVFLNLIKDYFEDKECKDRDVRQNNSITRLVEGHSVKQIAWKQVRVGDVLEVHEDQNLPADLLFCSCQSGQTTLVDTKNLDGENCLKSKFRCKIELPCVVEYQGPNSQFYRFIGKGVDREGLEVVLSPENVLLRGMKLKGQSWVRGVVLYTGHECKTMLNVQGTGLKVSKVELISRRIVALLICSAVLIGFLGAGVSLSENKTPLTSDQKFVYFLTKMISNIILVDNFISMSVIVGLEIGRKYFCLSVGWDSAMGASKAVNSSIVENLGQVGFILSDKTGTLTKNSMRFKRVCVGGNYYGHSASFAKDYVDFQDNSFRPDQHKMFLLCMSLCHEAVIRKDQLASSSSEEICFLTFAAMQGYEFKGRRDTSHQLFYQLQIFQNQLLQQLSVRILAVFPFDHSRKRQSVIVLIDNEIHLICKGADSTVLPLLVQGKFAREAISNFSKEGLRTMLFARKKLEKKRFQEWHKRYITLQLNLDFDAGMLNLLMEEIERGLELEAVVAIEDQLQNDLHETMGSLREAGIKFWIATGDSCEPVKHLLILSGQDVSTFKNYNEALDYVRQLKLLVDGADITTFVNDPKVQIAIMKGVLKTVIFYRCTPLQKSQIASYLRELGACVLTIGDGDNDVSMLKEGDVGVAVRGVEGCQATGVADVVIDEFRLLKRLLLMHGREFHRRLYSLVFILQFKNVWMGLIEFYFGTIHKFTGSPFLEAFSKQLYNLVYTLPPLFHQTFYDYQFLPPQLLKNKPNRYSLGQKNMQSVPANLVYWSILSVTVPAVAFYLSTSFGQAALNPAGYYRIQLQSGYVAMSALVFYANFKAVFGLSIHGSIMALFEIVLGQGIFLLAYLAISLLFSSSYIYGYGYFTAAWWLYLDAAVLSVLLIGLDLFVKYLIKGAIFAFARSKHGTQQPIQI